jgi:hypothetical protein
MLSLWKKQGKAGEGDWRGSYIDKTWNRQGLYPHPLLHYCQYVPLDCASGSVSGAKPHVAFHLRGKEKGRGNDVGPTCQQQQPNCVPFQFPFIILLRHGRGAIFNLQPSSSSPLSTSILVANFIPLQLQSSLPTSSLVTANFNPRRYSNSKPRCCAISSPSP